MQANKDQVPDVKHRYHVERFPSFYFITPGKNAKESVKFSDAREYDSLLEWMRLKARQNGAKLIVDEAEPEIEEEINFEEPPNSYGDEDEDENEEEEVSSTIESITDVESGEQLHVEITDPMAD